MLLLKGVDRYLGTPYAPQHPERPVVWHKGSARLLDCGIPKDIAEKKPLVLLIPSLINRYYILDLTPQTSFVAFLHKQGLHPFILDWGEPGQAEEKFCCGDYITKYLGSALRDLHALTGRKVVLAGYCMGGLFAIAAAQQFSQYVEKLALIATPWDFHAGKEFNRKWSSTETIAFKKYVEECGGLSADDIQMLFHLAAPQAFVDKFSHYATMRADSADAKRFLAVEYWANDGTKLVPGTAVECYIDWLQHNKTHHGNWRVAGSRIRPGTIKQPTLVVVPENDRIVPKASAMMLADVIKHSAVIQPESGHIGMLVGKKRKQQLWNPFVEWVAT